MDASGSHSPPRSAGLPENLEVKSNLTSRRRLHHETLRREQETRLTVWQAGVRRFDSALPEQKIHHAIWPTLRSRRAGSQGASSKRCLAVCQKLNLAPI